MSAIFDTMSPRSFEQLVQALAIAVFGSGVRVYGDGPDAGREASIEGEVPYPTQEDRWRGYTVIQVKFRLKPTGDTRDADWLVKQLQAEAKKFSSPERKLRCPDNYLLVSNVSLSSIESPSTTSAASTPPKKGVKRRPPRGGQQKLEDAAKRAKNVLWKQGFDWWHADKLERLLENHEGIRRRYAAWLTTGDVIADVVSWIALKRVDFDRAITQYLQRCLYEDRWVNLRQAGYQDDKQTGLANVFIDLPFALASDNAKEEADEADAQEGMEASNEGREYLVGHLVQSLKDKLDPNSVSPPNGSFSGPQANRFVLIGGPGQGKSTLSQYLAQLHRVALLAPRRARVSPDNRPILDELINQCRADGTALPSARRFPVRIDLPRFSDALDKAVKAGGQETSLIEYIAGQIRATAHMDLELEDLRAWLREYPWLIILDGLDEVPPSGNRGPVINSIREFWDEVVGCESDLAMLVTTRRQGFNDDLSPTYYNHIELVHLTTEQALTYAKRLLEYRIPNDEERAATLSRLHAASKEMATARLMVSPLQVTIMAALVQAKGDLPQDRWGLFDGYYSVVRNREQGKPEPVSRLLRTYGKDIEAVHHFAGLVLHIESERKGGADATMPVEHLREMVVQRLLSEEHSEAESRSVAEQIVGEAMTRLILLTSNNGQDIGFEIRSLQEFMASAALMGGSDSEKQKRLAYISDKSHWRHVFLFAAGRCFSEVSSEHLRASVYEICDDLDSVGEDEVHRTIRTGAKLALDLLEDAAAAGQPRPFRHLASRALRLLDVEDAGYAGRLAKVYHAYAAEQYKEAIESRLADRSRAEAWRLLFELNVRRIEWAGKRVRDYLSEASKQELYRVLIMGIRADSKSKENAEIISDGIKWVGFREAMDLASVFKDLPNESRLMKALLALQDSEDQDARVEVSVMPERGRSVLRLRMLGLFGNIRSVYREIAELRPDWNVFRIVGELASRPSQEALSAALLKLADLVESDDDSDSEIRFQFGYLPWVLGVFVSGEPKSTAFRTGAEQVARGQFGGLADWEKAERRWKANGISEADVLASANSHGIPPNIGECGSPPFRSYSVSICPEAGQIGDYLIALARKIPDGGYKHDVLHAAVFCISACRESGKYEIVPLLKSLIEVGRHAWASCLPSMSVEFWEEESVVELANRIGLNEKWFREKRLSEIHATILRSVHTHPDKNGLLVLLAMSGPGVEDERGAVEKVGYLADVDAPANVVLAHAILCARNGLFDMVNAEKVAAADLPYRVKARWLEALASSIAERASEEAAKRLALKLIGAGAHHRMLYRGLSKLADLQRTEFHVEDRWDSLALPNAYFPFTAPTS